MSGRVWQSARLHYRAIEATDEPFLKLAASDSEAFMSRSTHLALPPTNKSIVSNLAWLQDSFLSVIICLPTSATADQPPTLVPIGDISLFNIDPRQAHHRTTTIGLGITAPYQNQGYGTEAIRWVLDFAFRRANLHRVEIAAFAHNERAVGLYEKLGFVVEGRRREACWHDGRWWDIVEFGMLEREWWRMQ